VTVPVMVAADAATANRAQSALTIAGLLRVFGLILFFLWAWLIAFFLMV